MQQPRAMGANGFVSLRDDGERSDPDSWRPDLLTQPDKQEFEQEVHITWERGSIYFDTIKIRTRVSDAQANPGQTGLAFV